VREDVTEGFLERVQEVCQQILQRIKEYNDLVTYNEAFVRRVSGRGVITKEMVARHRMTGIPARVFDREQDLRWSSSRLGYFGLKPEALESIEAITFPGDVHHRFVIRLHEVSQSAQILQVLSQKLAAGPFLAKGSAQLIVPEGEAEAEAEVETARGRLAVRVGSQAGRPGPAEIQFSPPSRALFDAVPQYLVGAPLQDLSLLLQSIDLLATEVDR
jgi:NADH:ubiquinone oxidoreductase subunit D